MRFSQGLIQSLINPSYQRNLGLIGNSLGQRVSGVPQAKEQAARRMEDGKRAIFQLLNTGDVSNPQVLQAAQAVAQKYGVPAAEVAQMVQMAQQSQNARTRLDQNSTRIDQANTRIGMQQRAMDWEQQTMEAQKALQGHLGAVTSGMSPEAVNKYIEARVPTEDQAKVRSGYQTWRAREDQNSQERQRNAPLSDKYLESATKGGVPRELVEDYKDKVDRGDMGAVALKQQIMKLYSSNALDAASIERRSGPTESSVKSWEKNMALDAIDDFNDVYKGFLDGKDPVEQEHKQAFALFLIEKVKTDEGGGSNFLPDEIEKLYAEFLSIELPEEEKVVRDRRGRVVKKKSDPVGIL